MPIERLALFGNGMAPLGLLVFPRAPHIYGAARRSLQGMHSYVNEVSRSRFSGKPRNYALMQQIGQRLVEMREAKQCERQSNRGHYQY